MSRPATLLYTQHCIVCGVRLPQGRRLCSECRAADSAPSRWARLGALEPPTLHGLGSALAFVLAILAAVLVFVTWAAAEDYPIVVTHEPDFGLYFVAELAIVDDFPGHPVALAPSVESAPIALGLPTQPFAHVYADGYSASGQAGLDTTLHFVGCTIIIRGGLIVETRAQFGGPCP